MTTEQFEESNLESLGDEENLVEDKEEQEDSEYQLEDGQDTQENTEEEANEEEEETEDIEVSGKKYKIPVSLKPALLMQQDYTKKTEEVAQQRRDLETQVKFQQQHIESIAKLMSLDDQIAQFDNIDWPSYIEADPIQAQKLILQASQLKDARSQLIYAVQQTENQLKANKQAEINKAIFESETILKRDIKNWSPDLESKLQTFAKQLGFDSDDIRDAKVDPRIYKLLNLAFTGNQVLSKKVKPSEVVVKPATSIKAKQSKHKEPHNMSFSEFKKWRVDTIKQRNK